MIDCKILIPLEKVVNAALLDSYETAGKSKELFYHFAARGLKKLQQEQLRVGLTRVMLRVNHNTKTATLPPDFDGELFVGIVENGRRVPVSVDTSLVPYEIPTIEIENACVDCGQDKAICNDMTVTESTEIVIVNNLPFEQTTIKKLYPDGTYYLEVNTPYFNMVTSAVEYVPIKKFVTKFDLKKCGCVEVNEENLHKIKSCCPDVYACHFSVCGNYTGSGLGGYLILEDLGLIQLDYNFRYDYIYLEYRSFMQKINGQYVVPQVAFETLVEWTKYKSVQNKKNVSRGDKSDYLNSYRRERDNMEKIMGRITLDSIIDSARRVPNFDLDWGIGRTTCRSTSNNFVSQITSSPVSDICISALPPNTNVGNANGKHISPFQLAVIAGDIPNTGVPVDGQFTYTNEGLIGALSLNVILVNENNETTLSGQFSFNPVTGTITRVNPWVILDRLIVSFAKLV